MEVPTCIFDCKTVRKKAIYIIYYFIKTIMYIYKIIKKQRKYIGMDDTGCEKRCDVYGECNTGSEMLT